MFAFGQTLQNEDIYTPNHLSLLEGDYEVVGGKRKKLF